MTGQTLRAMMGMRCAASQQHPWGRALIEGARARGSCGVPGARLLTAVAVLVAGLALLPFAFIVWVTIETGWSTAQALIFRPRVAELLVNTCLLVSLAVPLSVALGVALAWLTERTDLPGARLLSWAAVAPLAIPAFVHSYAWVSLAPGLQGLLAAVVVSVLAYFPFVYLPVSAALRRLDPGLEDAASSLGLAPWAVVRRVVLPQLKLAAMGGALLIGLHLLAEYGLFVMIRFDTFTTAIVDQFQSTYNGPAANMLGGVLIACALGLLWGEAKVRGQARYARLGAGAARLQSRMPLGRMKALALTLPVLTAALSLGVPLFTLAHWLIKGGLGVWRLADVVPAIGQTLGLAVAGAIVTTLAALPLAWLSVRSPGRLVRWLEACTMSMGSLPGVVVALALVTITIRVAQPIYQTTVTVLLAYLIIFLPRALVTLRAGIAQVPAGLEEAAGSLGRSPMQALWLITLRLAAPSAAAALALVGLGITNELTATLMLEPNGTTTLATQFWALSNEIDYAGAAPYAVLMVLLSLPMTVLLYHQSRQVAGR